MNKIGAILPLIPPACLLINLIDGPIQIAVINGWKNMFGCDTDDGNSTVGDAGESENTRRDVPTVEAQLFAYVCVAILGYVATNNLIPKIK
eukprot:1887006-Ditylum_brightwellii.AAC.1